MRSLTDITVRGYHIDHFGHVNHGRYVEFLEEARWQYLEDNHLLEPIHRIGAIHVVSKIEVKYLYPAKAGVNLRVETRVSGRSDKQFNVAQKIMLLPSGKPVVDALVTNVFVNADGRMRPIDKQILDIWPDLAATQKMVRNG